MLVARNSSLHACLFLLLFSIGIASANNPPFQLPNITSSIVDDGKYGSSVIEPVK